MLESNIDVNQEGGLFLGLGKVPTPNTIDEAIKLLAEITRRSLYKLIFDWTQEKSKGLFSGTMKAEKKLEAFQKFIYQTNITANQKMFDLTKLDIYKPKYLTRILLGMLYTYLIQSSLDQTNIDNFSKEVHKVISPKDFVDDKSPKGTSEYRTCSAGRCE